MPPSIGVTVTLSAEILVAASAGHCSSAAAYAGEMLEAALDEARELAETVLGAQTRGHVDLAPDDQVVLVALGEHDLGRIALHNPPAGPKKAQWKPLVCV